MSTSSTSTTNVPFTGISQYASDFQAILNKAVEVAQIPITQLQAEDSTVLSKETALGSLSGAVSSLATSLQSLGTLASEQALSATSSDPSAVTATTSAGAVAGTYTINSVTSAATAASERSLASYSSSGPVSSMTLVVGSTPTTFALTTNSLNGLATQINSLTAGVTATVVNSGGSNYLSLTSNSGPQTIQLYDAPTATGTDLLTGTGSGTEQTNAGFANPDDTPVSTPSFTIQLGSTIQTFQLTDDSLTGLSNAINALGLGVTASILTTSGGNYLSLQAGSTGATTLGLYEGTDTTGTDLLTGTNQGTDAVFQLNGINIDQPGNVVNNVIPGVTLTIQGASSSPVTLTLASDPTQLSSALQNFVTQYNALQTAIAGQVGAGGPLGGDTILNQVQQSLQQMVSYTIPTGTVQSLADLGVEFGDTTGQLTFDQNTFDSLSQTQIADAFTYLGSATTGLAGFSQTMTEYSDPITGLIQSEVSGLKTTDQDLQNQISTLNTNITNMQTALTAQLEGADAIQAELQQQQSDLTASLEGLSLVLYGKNQAVLG